MARGCPRGGSRDPSRPPPPEQLPLHGSLSTAPALSTLPPRSCSTASRGWRERGARASDAAARLMSRLGGLPGGQHRAPRQARDARRCRPRGSGPSALGPLRSAILRCGCCVHVHGWRVRAHVGLVASAGAWLPLGVAFETCTIVLGGPTEDVLLSSVLVEFRDRMLENVLLAVRLPDRRLCSATPTSLSSQIHVHVWDCAACTLKTYFAETARPSTSTSSARRAHGHARAAAARANTPNYPKDTQ